MAGQPSIHAKPDMAHDAEEERPVAALERGLRILAAFSLDVPELSLTELSERIGIHKSTVMRLANTLEKAGYLQRSAAGKYCLGVMTLPLARVYRASMQPPEIILAVMRELASLTGESITFSVRRGELRICVYRVESPNRIRAHFSVGDVAPIGLGASGRVFALFDDKPRNRSTGAAGRKGKPLVQSSADELTDGMAGIAAPVFDDSGALHGALAVSGPKVRLGAHRLTTMHGSLVAAAREITFRLGGDTALFDASGAAPRPAAKQRAA